MALTGTTTVICMSAELCLTSSINNNIWAEGGDSENIGWMDQHRNMTSSTFCMPIEIQLHFYHRNAKNIIDNVVFPCAR